MTETEQIAKSRRYIAPRVLWIPETDQWVLFAANREIIMVSNDLLGLHGNIKVESESQRFAAPPRSEPRPRQKLTLTLEDLD